MGRGELPLKMSNCESFKKRSRKYKRIHVNICVSLCWRPSNTQVVLPNFPRWFQKGWKQSYVYCRFSGSSWLIWMMTFNRFSCSKKKLLVILSQLLEIIVANSISWKMTQTFLFVPDIYCEYQKIFPFAWLYQEKV